MNSEQEEALKILVETAKAILQEVEDSSEVAYWLDEEKFTGRLRKALDLLGESYPQPWRAKYEAGRIHRP